MAYIEDFRAYAENVSLTVHPNGHPVVILVGQGRAGIRILAGCRNFTLRQARKHWGPKWRPEVRAWIDRQARALKWFGHRLHDAK